MAKHDSFDDDIFPLEILSLHSRNEDQANKREMLALIGIQM